MVKIFISATVLYALIVVIYFMRIRAMKKRKKDIVGKGSSVDVLKTDIVGKSRFEGVRSQTEVTTSVSRGKPDEKEEIASSEVSQESSDDTYSDNPPDDEELELLDISVPLEYEYEDENDDDSDGDDDNDGDEYDEEETENEAPANTALGLDFDSLVSTLKTVDKDEKATPEERQKAGKVLVEIRKTDMFEQIVSGKPSRASTVSSVMSEHLAAFYASQNVGTPTRTAPKDFDVNKFV